MNKVKDATEVTDPQRITRIFQKMCQSQVLIFVKPMNSSGTVVKGRVNTLEVLEEKADGRELGVEIINISERGIRYLLDKKTLKLEFVMMSVKIVASCKLLRIDATKILISFPTTLYNIERRTSTRYKPKSLEPAFAQLSIWHPDAHEHTAPPVFNQYREISNYLRIVDVSLNGFCLLSSFPAVFKAIEEGAVDSKATLILPMEIPFKIHLNVRWIKNSKNYSKISQKKDSAIHSYYIGCQVTQHTEYSKRCIQKFIQKIIESKAI